MTSLLMLSPRYNFSQLKILKAKNLNYKTQGTTKLLTIQRPVDKLKNFASSQLSSKLVLPPSPVVFLVVQLLELSVQRTPHLFACNWVHRRYFFFPWKKEIVYRLSHIPGVRFLGAPSCSVIFDLILPFPS